MTANETCISCGMPMASESDHAPGSPESSWCSNCSAPDGKLQEFEERFTRMVQWEMRKRGADRVRAESATRTYMRKMPAWKDHPSLRDEKG